MTSLCKKQYAWMFGVLACIPACSNNPAPSRSTAAPSNARAAALKANAPAAHRIATAGAVATPVAEADKAIGPQFIWATKHESVPAGTKPEAAARAYIARFTAAAAKLPAGAMAGVEQVRVADLGRGGLISHLRQRLDGVEVYKSDVKVLMRRNLDLVAVSGQLKSLRKNPGSKGFTLSPAGGLAAALSQHHNVAVSASDIVDRKTPQGAWERFELGAISARAPFHLSDARTKRVWFPSGDVLIPAYFIEFYTGKTGSVDAEAFRYIIAADDGRVLERRDLTANDSFNYRVWADVGADHRPYDGPQADYAPHPAGFPDGTDPAFVAPSLIAIEGFNHNPNGLDDAWLPAGSTQTFGNNADAYSDYNAPDGYSNGDQRATTTSTATFDRIYDTSAIPINATDPTTTLNQTLAGVTQAFYVVNWMHDWWYDSGFNEAAGNAQRDNYHRGGAQGDAMRVEVQDSYLAGQRNNANMSTPEDGLQPRMQIYVFGAPILAQSLTLTPGGSVATGSAAFGPQSFNVTTNVAYATPANGCTSITNNVAGQIALIDRGTCAFVIKVANAQAAGAIGVIIANNAAGTVPPGLGGTDPTLTIPTLSVTLTDGNAIKANLGAGTVSATMNRQVGVERDAAIDNDIVAHEWGHYLHHRLADCGSQQCRSISEGWGDFNALLMSVREGDNLDGTYAAAVYAPRNFGESAYFGIRRTAYSYDMTRDALLFHHISDGQALPTAPVPFLPNGAVNSEVHNAGEIWASMMFDTYIALQKDAANRGRTFEQVRRAIGDYVVTGLQLTPIDATFVEQRDAILAAIAARDMQDLSIAANAFARRGAGSCAVAPARYSTNHSGVVESYTVQPRSDVGAVLIDDNAAPCDRDGFLDAGESGHVTVTVSNGGAVAMTDTTVTLSTATTGITFPSGPSATIAMIPPFQSATVTLDIALDAAVSGQGQLDLDVTIDNAAACETSLARTFVQRINLDDRPASSANDSVDSPTTAWTRTGFQADQVWDRAEVDVTDYAWFGGDSGTQSDTQLESPDLVVSPSDPFVMEFDHLYRFENSGSPVVYYDGGVIELSQDGGRTWQDVSTLLATNPYGSDTIASNTGNPLAGRPGYLGASASFASFSYDHVTLDFGTALAGRTVRVRFRIGADAGTSDFGWLIDNLAFSGITNLPFAALVDNAGQCVCAPELTECGSACTDVGSDINNCGGCGNVCAAGTLCARGQCVAGCATGLALCGSACVNLQTDNANCGSCNTFCASGNVCASGQCQVSCLAGQTNCNGICANLQSDNANCGACGTTCALGQVCNAGQCALTCQAGLSNCGGVCSNLQNDNANCGACGNVCATGQVCNAGQCALTCQAGLSNCGGVCSNLQNDNANCGACGNTCAPGQACSAGQCAVTCQAGLTDCGGTCSNLQSDRNNCGACGTACGGDQTCVAGQCSVAACRPGLTDCNGTCIDVLTDRGNCGACGTACAAGQVCSTGQCALSCQTGLTDCNGTCANLQSDRANCGACGTSCTAGQVCSAGQCAVSCQTGQTDCGGTCTNLQSDRANCGACGTSCAVGQVCSAGQCAVSCQTGQTDCGGTCTNLQSDNANCGACGTSCAAGSACRAGRCRTAPVANAGAGQIANIGDTVRLDASGSSDADGDSLTYAWSQTAGPSVTLSATQTAATTFVAPQVTTATRLSFRVTVSDDQESSSATVDVTVQPPAVPKSGCSVAADGRTSGSPWMMAVLLFAPLAWLNRRRFRLHRN